MINGKLIHSGRNPQREAERAVADIVRREPPCVIILGLGLGYHARAILDETETTYILAFEPSATIREFAKETVPTGKSSRMTIATSVDELDQNLPLLAASGYEQMLLRSRFADSEDELEEALSTLDAFASRLEINQNTLARFGKLWVRNLCHNLDALAHGVGVSALRDTLSGIPALLLAAGPSLDEVLPSLPMLSRRMAVIAVDTAVQHARNVGVEPDFAVVVDPQYWNARHLDTVGDTTAILVAETAAHPVVFRRFDPPYLLCSSVFPLGIRYERRLGSFGQLGAGGSVSTTAWDLLRLTGASTIFAAGLDLGFPQGRTHCRGSFFEELAVASGTRLEPASGVALRSVYAARPHPVHNYNGGSLISDARMDIYRAWFERRVRDEQLPTYTLSSASSRIPGVAVADIRSLVTLPVLRSEITARLNLLRSVGEKEDSARHHAAELLVARRKQISEETMQLIRELGDLELLARRALEIMDTIAAHRKQGVPVDFGPLETIDRQLQFSDARAVASFLMQEAITTVQGGFGSKNIDEQIEASRLIYDSLQESIAFHIDRLQSSRQRAGFS